MDGQLSGGEVAQPGRRLAGVAVRRIRWDVALIAVAVCVAVCVIVVRVAGFGVRGDRVGRPAANDGGALLGAEVAGGEGLGQQFLRDRSEERRVGKESRSRWAQ